MDTKRERGNTFISNQRRSIALPSNLKFYKKEREIFAEEFGIKIPDKMVKKIAKKIARHFHIALNKIRIRGNKWCYALPNGDILFAHNPSLLAICHELSHEKQIQEKGKTAHSKKLITEIKRMLNYARKKNFWGLQK